ncbi:MAG: histidine--tRNA ligase, partial [Oscillospiraceae bacterium]|nr:histidine--tRNA ligase [Oscillospiraceae bacterium]
MNMLKRPNGTEDILPASSQEWQNLEKFLRDTAGAYGFREIRIPTFEQTELFSRGVGETTDVVQKEMYTVTAKESTFTLRPEGTAGTIRAMLQNGLLNEALPQRVYYILSCFRHERPQAGRLREFHQFGVEMAGASSADADAEVISLAKQILDQIGLRGIELYINSIGCPVCRKHYHAALKQYFSSYQDQLCETCQERLDKNPMRILDCKSPVCQEIAENAPVILDYLCEDCNSHFEKLKANLDLLSIEYTVNPRIVRGLDYYTKTVFEFVTTDIGAQGTICGGGRYDGLIAQLGGQSTPALGFGMGLERLLLTLRNQGISLNQENTCDIYFVPMGENAVAKAMQLTAQLRQDGISAQTDVMGRSLRAQMKYADKIHARFTVVIGDNELEQNEAILKNMKSGEKVLLKLDETFAQHFSDIEIADRLG